MLLCYSRKSAPTAMEISIASGGDLRAVRRNDGDINWGRARANTELNPDTSKATNKRLMRTLFRENEVPMPRLYSQGEELRFPVVGRPDTHMKGRGFWLCYNQADVIKALRGTRRKKAATHFMEYVRAPREYRVHIFKGKSIRISEKVFGSSGATAHGLYTTGKPQHNVKHIRKAAKKAVAALGLDFGAVDILADDTNCWVLEVNTAPGLGGSMPKVYYETFKRYFEGDW